MKAISILCIALAGIVAPPLRRLFATTNAEGLTGTHECAVSRLTSAAITTRHLLYKQGADADHVAIVTATTDVPLGTIADEATAAEAIVAVQLLGKGSTKKCVANAAIAAGVIVYLAATGKVAAAGTVVVGKSLTASAADGDVIEVLD
jgi:hypothetical protein